MANYFKTILVKKQVALGNMRQEITILTQKVLENPKDGRAPYWENRLLKLAELIPQKETLVKILKGFAKNKEVSVRKRVLTPGELFQSKEEIQALLAPTIAVIALKDNNGGFVVFSQPMMPKRASDKLRSRFKNPQLRNLLVVRYNHKADPLCSECRQNKKLRKTNLCRQCQKLYVALNLLKDAS